MLTFTPIQSEKNIHPAIHLKQHPTSDVLDFMYHHNYYQMFSLKGSKECEIMLSLPLSRIIVFIVGRPPLQIKITCLTQSTSTKILKKRSSLTHFLVVFSSVQISLPPIMSEKVCLQWNEFKANTSSAFGRLRDDKEFTDVTLACEDGQQMEAHKVILAASSPFFGEILQRNKHPHPLIYLHGFQPQDLLAVLDFLYFGEANVYQENLDSFLAIAEELKLKGLTGQTSSDKMKQETPSTENAKQKKLPESQQLTSVMFKVV